MTRNWSPLPGIYEIPIDVTTRRRFFKRIDTEIFRCIKAVNNNKDPDGRNALRIAQIQAFREQYAEWRRQGLVPPPRSEGRARAAAAPQTAARAAAPEPKPTAPAPDFPPLNVTPLAIEEPFLALPAPPAE